MSKKNMALLLHPRKPLLCFLASYGKNGQRYASSLLQAAPNTIILDESCLTPVKRRVCEHTGLDETLYLIYTY